MTVPTVGVLLVRRLAIPMIAALIQRVLLTVFVRATVIQIVLVAYMPPPTVKVAVVPFPVYPYHFSTVILIPMAIKVTAPRSIPPAGAQTVVSSASSL